MGKKRQELMERVKAQGKAFKAILAPDDDAIDAAIDSSASLDSPARNGVKKQDEPFNQEQPTPKTAQASAATKQAVVTPPPPPKSPARARAVKRAVKKSASTTPSAPYSNQFISAVAKQAKKQPRRKAGAGMASASNKAAANTVKPPAPPRRNASARVKARPRQMTTTPPPAPIIKRDSSEQSSSPPPSHYEPDFDLLDSGYYDHYIDHDPVYDYEQQQGIVAPLGLSDDQLNAGSLCGQPKWAFENVNDAVPAGSFYEDFVWSALESEQGLELGAFTIELYVRERQLNEKGIENKQARYQNTFDFERHTLVRLPKEGLASYPWGYADRVLLVPKTYKKETFKRRNQKDGVHYEPDVQAVKAQLSNKGLHPAVVHGWCHISFLDDKRAEHLSAYWVILPKDELQKRHDAWQEELERLEKEPEFNKRQIDHLKQSINQPPSKRYLGLWNTKQAKQVYQSAYEKAGVQVPKDWPKEDSIEAQELHLARQEQKKRENKQEQEANYIQLPLSASAPMRP